MDIYELFHYIEAELKKVFNRPSPDPFRRDLSTIARREISDDYFDRQNDMRSMTNPEYYYTWVELRWNIDSDDYQIHIQNSVGTTPRRVSLAVYEGKISSFTINRHWGAGDFEEDNEFKDFEFDQLDRLMVFILGFISWHPIPD